MTPEDDSVAPGSCSNGVDDDGDTDTDFDDSDCADADGDTIPDNVDNCDEAANPLQLDADTSTPAGDACEDAHIVGLEAVASTNGANSELRGRLMEPAPKMLHEFIGGIVTVTDPDWSIAPGGAVPNGAIREALTTAVTTSMSPSHTCNTSLPVNFTLVDASTDPTQTIDAGADFSNLLNDANTNELPDGVDLMPSFLVDLPGLDNDGDGRVDEDPPGGIPVIDGGVDVNGDTVIGVDDDGDYLGYQVIDGGMDIDGDTAVDASDDGIIAGVGIIDGSVDVNDDAAIDVDDDGDPWDDEDNDGDGRIDEDPLPLARLFGSWQGPTSATVLNVLIYNPVPLDNDGDGDVDEEVTPLVDDDGDTLIDEDTPEGYNAIFVLGDPTVSPFTGGISAFCTPFDMRQFRYAISLDNPSTASDEGDWTLLTNPSAGETERFFTRVTTQPDKDGDGIENSLDTCVNEEDNDGDTLPDQSDPDPWNPRLVSPPGDADGDGIPTLCDPDGEGAGFLALTSCTDDWDCDTVNDTEDNCLVLSNADQSDLDGDEIGDVCDDDTTLPNGATQHFNGGKPECIDDDDLDKDGLCASLETALGTNDSDVKSVPETSLWNPLVCSDGLDNDGDELEECGGIDLEDCGCGDLDNDGVLNDEDNCPLTPNGEDEAGEPGVGDQTDFDSDTGPGDVGSQPFLRSTLGDPEGAPSDVLGAPFLRSDKWGGDACDPDDDNDFLPDGSEPAGTCISTGREPQFDDDCDKDYLGDLVEYISSDLYSPPDPPWPDPAPSTSCLDPLAADDYTANPDGDSLFTYGEAVIYLEAVIRGETVIPMRPCDVDTELAVDLDGDEFDLGIELFTLTDPETACAATPDMNDEDPDAWPPDWDDSQVPNLLDLLPFKAHFNATDPMDPRYGRRYDLFADGANNLLELLPFKPYFNDNRCTP